MPVPEWILQKNPPDFSHKLYQQFQNSAYNLTYQFLQNRDLSNIVYQYLYTPLYLLNKEPIRQKKQIDIVNDFNDYLYNYDYADHMNAEIRSEYYKLINCIWMISDKTARKFGIWLSEIYSDPKPIFDDNVWEHKIDDLDIHYQTKDYIL